MDFTHFRNERSHSDRAIEMLDFFSTGDLHYKKCIKLITTNYKSYTAIALFELAKLLSLQNPKSTVKCGYLNEQSFDVSWQLAVWWPRAFIGSLAYIANVPTCVLYCIAYLGNREGIAFH